LTFTVYANTGPFIANTVPPGLSATFFNNIEGFLDQIDSSIVADSLVTADGAGHVSAVSLTATGAGTGLAVSHNATVSGTLTTAGMHTANGGLKGVLTSIGGGHTLTDWNWGIAGGVSNAGVTVTHGIKNAGGTSTTPNVIFALIDANALSEICMADNAGTTTFRLSTNTSTARNVWWLALLA